MWFGKPDCKTRTLEGSCKNIPTSGGTFGCGLANPTARQGLSKVLARTFPPVEEPLDVVWQTRLQDKDSRRFLQEHSHQWRNLWMWFGKPDCKTRTLEGSCKNI